MIFDGIVSWVKGVWNKMITKTAIKKALHIDVSMSEPMIAAIRLWARMYENDAEWLNADVISLNLAATISSEISRITTIEMVAKFEEESKRGKYLEEQFEKVIEKIRTTVEYGAAKGGIALKPYVSEGNINVDFIQADQFFPIKFDPSGGVQSCVFVDQRTIGRKFYTRLEYHETLPENKYVVRNTAYQSSSKGTLGKLVSLEVVDDWAELQPETHLKGIEKPLFAYFRYPLANNIDVNSPLGVSCYSRADELIKNADIQWSNFLWEFESSQRALYVDLMAFDKDDNDKPVLPIKRLYRALNASGSLADEELFHEWTPDIREENILRGLDAILKRIEFTVGLAYGTLSDPQNVDKTATEINASKQRTYSTVVDTQKELSNTLDHLLYAMDAWATLYKLAPAGSYTVTYEFDDSVIVDKDAAFQQDLRLVSQGIMGRVEFRMRNFGEDEETAIKMVGEAQAEKQAEQDLFKDNIMTE